MKFGYTLIYVPNVEEAAAFYEAAFSIKRRFVHDSGQYAEMETGATALGFVGYGMVDENHIEVNLISRKATPPGIEIAFVTPDVQAAYDRACKAGAEGIATPTQRPWGQTVAYVRDLNGMLVELCSPMS